MTETHNPSATPNEAPQVKDKAPRPQGVLPKNMQSWVIIGISLVMVIVIALSGGKTPKSAGPVNPPRSPSIVDPNEARIQEYRQQIEEDARKLVAEQERLRQAQAAMGMTSEPPAFATPPEARPHIPAYAPANRGEQPRDQQPEKTAIEQDRNRREHESLFASNIALSLRRNDNAGKDAAPTAGGPGQPMATLPSNPFGNFPAALPALPASPPQAQAAGQLSTGAALPGKPEGKPNETVPASRKDKRAEDPHLAQAEGKTYRLFEGTVIETVLTNRLTGSFAGPVNCMITTAVYSHDRSHVLVPEGTRVLGEVSKVDHFGQERLAVFFHRLIMPDGYSVRLDRFAGLNQIGETGLRDKVNNHYARIFGASLAIGAIAGLAQVSTRYGYDSSLEDIYRQGASRSIADSSLRILDRFLNLLPTFTIREGHRVKIYLSGDLLLPAYDHHRMPGDL